MSDVVVNRVCSTVGGVQMVEPTAGVSCDYRAYCDAYGEYIRAYVLSCDGERVGVEGVKKHGSSLFGLVPPVWAGRGSCGGRTGGVFGQFKCGVDDVSVVTRTGCTREGLSVHECSVSRDAEVHGSCVGGESLGDGTGDSARVCDGGGRDFGDESGKVSEVTGKVSFSEGVSVGVAVSSRGKHYVRNKLKREAAKLKRGSVKDLKDVCPSLTGSVCTVDTRTAEEIEAVKTLAARRVVENKVAKRMAELKLASLNNKDKTDAVLRLEAARMEQRINEAKAKSQASFKECDTSLKSLGSTGSAGEFALKQEVKRGRDNEIRLKYAQLQNDYMIKHVPEHVRQVILDMPEPVFEHDAEVFGECPEDYDDEQRMAYDIEMNSRAAGVQY